MCFTIKPLEWDERNRADVYGVKDCYGQGPKRYFLYRASTIIGWYDDIEPAKAAAQTDHEARVRSALHPTPAPQDEALKAEVERLTKERDASARRWRDAFDNMHRRAMTAEAALSTPAPQGMETAVEAAEAAVYPRHEKGFLVKPLIGAIDMRAALTAAYPHMTGAAQEAVEAGLIAWETQEHGAIVATIIQHSEGCLEILKLVDGRFDVIVHQRKYESDNFEDLSIRVEAKHLAAIGALVATPQPAPGVNAEMLAALEEENERMAVTLAVRDHECDFLKRKYDEFRAAAEAQPTAVGCAIADIAAERRRQIEAEGWTPEHDDAYTGKEMARAAACYALAATSNNIMWRWWPWAEKWWKPTSHRRNLIKAGALIVAEIERDDRISAVSSNGGDDAA